MNRGIKQAENVTSWFMSGVWNSDNRHPKWVLRILWRLAKFSAWFGRRHPFNPWQCDSCAFEARCGYESEDEREIADRWRAENGIDLQNEHQEA